MRQLATLALLGLSGCRCAQLPNVDFRCEEGGRCEAPLVCRDGFCVSDSAGGGSGGGSAGGGGAAGGVGGGTAGGAAGGGAPGGGAAGGVGGGTAGGAPGGGAAGGGAAGGTGLWAVAIGDSRSLEVSIVGVAPRTAGGAAVTGGFYGTVAFGLRDHTAIGERPWVGWIDASGALLPVRSFGGGTGQADRAFPRGIATDPGSDRSFVTGVYSMGGLTFPDGIPAPSAASQSAFAVAFDEDDGGIAWRRTETSTLGVTVGRPGYLPKKLGLAGTFAGQLQLADGGVIGTGGNAWWWAALDGTNASVIDRGVYACIPSGYAEGLDVDVSGDLLYMAGRIGPCTAIATPANTFSVLRADLTNGGSLVMPYPGLVALDGRLDSSRGAISSEKGQPWVAAIFTGTIGIGPDVFTARPPGASNVLVAALDPLTLALTKLVQLGGADATVRELRMRDGAAVVGGTFAGSGFGADGGTIDSIDGGRDIYFARFSSGAAPVMTHVPGDGTELLGGFFLEDAGTVVAGGTFTRHIQVGGRSLNAASPISAFVGQVPLR